MSKPMRWALVLGMVVSLLGASAASASADQPDPSVVVTTLLGPGVCC